jgi:hypothetical protein
MNFGNSDNIKCGDILECVCNDIPASSYFSYHGFGRLKKGILIKVVATVNDEVWGTTEIESRLVADINVYAAKIEWFRKLDDVESIALML